MRHIATDVARSVACVSVCVSRCVLDARVSCAENDWTDGYAVWGLTHAGPRKHVLDGVQIHTGRGTFERGTYGTHHNVHTHGERVCRVHETDTNAFANDADAASC